MGAYIIRRLLLIIPTLIGIMVVNFALIQFVPGGPIEQIIANMEGQGVVDLDHPIVVSVSDKHVPTFQQLGVVGIVKV